jgi:outer membrane protein OmpA-like peptidoglycan-associated protein
VWKAVAVTPVITKGELRFEVFFALNSVVITQAEKKNIAAQVAAIKKKAGSKATIKVQVEGWVQPTIKTGNVEFLSKYRAKHVATLMKQLGLAATYKELYKGLGVDNLPKMRHASVTVTWSINK